MDKVYLLIGSNLGNREKNLSLAQINIEKHLGKTLSASSIYETEPNAIKTKNYFLNQAVSINTQLTPENLIQKILEIEKSMGRTRKKNISESRIIDIDILFYSNLILESPSLTVPHPKLELRKFVLIPLNEIAGNMIHPKINKTIKHLLKACQDTLEVKIFKNPKSS